MNLTNLIRVKTFRIILASSAPIFILIMFAYSVVLTLIFTPVLEFLNKHYPVEQFINKNTSVGVIVFVVVVGPIVETLIFQSFLIGYVLKYVRNKLAVVLISSILFAAGHYSSYAYAFSALLGGIILSQTYLFSIKKHYSPFTCTAVLHALRNGLAVILSVLFD